MNRPRFPLNRINSSIRVLPGAINIYKVNLWAEFSVRWIATRGTSAYLPFTYDSNRISALGMGASVVEAMAVVGIEQRNTIGISSVV